MPRRTNHVSPVHTSFHAVRRDGGYPFKSAVDLRLTPVFYNVGRPSAIINGNIVCRCGLINGQKVVDIGKTHVILQSSQAEYALKPPWRQGRSPAQGAEVMAAIQTWISMQIGFLFEHSTKVRQYEELIVFITPKIVKYDIKPEVAH